VIFGVKIIRVGRLTTFGTDEMHLGMFALVNFPAALWADQAVSLDNQILVLHLFQTFGTGQSFHDFPPFWKAS